MMDWGGCSMHRVLMFDSVPVLLVGTLAGAVGRQPSKRTPCGTNLNAQGRRFSPTRKGLNVSICYEEFRDREND